jgi:hypothetical protein
MSNIPLLRASSNIPLSSGINNDNLLRTYVRSSTAQRNASYQANQQSSIDQQPLKRKHKPSFLDKDGPTVWNASTPGVTASILSFWLNKNSEYRLKEEFEYLTNLPDMEPYLHSPEPLLFDIATKVSYGISKGYVVYYYITRVIIHLHISDLMYARVSLEKWDSACWEEVQCCSATTSTLKKCFSNLKEQLFFAWLLAQGVAINIPQVIYNRFY